ncbi:MAG: hypothetical protein ACYCSN_16685, partial [Acidobacteriaceae bacterium]
TSLTASCLYSSVYLRRIAFFITVSSARLQQLAMRDVFRGQGHSGDNLAIQIKNPRFYKCWAGCTKEEIRAAIGQPIRKRALV